MGLFVKKKGEIKSNFLTTPTEEPKLKTTAVRNVISLKSFFSPCFEPLKKEQISNFNKFFQKKNYSFFFVYLMGYIAHQLFSMIRLVFIFQDQL